MQTTGSLLLLVSLGLLLVVAIGGVQDLSGRALTSNSTIITDQTNSADHAINPVFYILGFSVLVIGAVIAIDSFR